MTNKKGIPETINAQNTNSGHNIVNKEAGKGVLSESDKIELLSEDVQEIMGHVPSWIVRWGITVLLLLLVAVISGSFVFKYPDVIKSSVVIVSENPPASIVAHSNGKIDYLFAENEKKVKPGEILAILENTTIPSHVNELKNKLSQLSQLFDSTNPVVYNLTNQYALGTIQGSFSNFQRQYNEYQNYLSVNLSGKKIVAIKQQVNDYSKYLERLQAQIRNQEKTVQLNYRQFKRDSSLYAGGVIAQAELEKSEQNYLQVKNNYQSLLATHSNTQMQVNQLNYQVIDLQSQKTEQTGKLLNSLKEAYDNLGASIAEWEKAYVLASPIEGKVTFTKYWSKNQYVIAGDVVFTVVPDKPQRILGRAKVPAMGSGKIETGQVAHIRLDNFPYTEFGMLEGRVESVSLIPESNQQGVFYTAEILLPKGLITNYQKTLPFNQEMQGIAEIVTKNMSLFERFINPVKAALKK